MPKHDVRAPVTGSIWMHSTSVGQEVEAGSTVVIMESMKMEFPVLTEVKGRVDSLVDAGTVVNEGDVVAVIEVT